MTQNWTCSTLISWLSVSGVGVDADISEAVYVWGLQQFRKHVTSGSKTQHRIQDDSRLPQLLGKNAAAKLKAIRRYLFEGATQGIGKDYLESAFEAWADNELATEPYVVIANSLGQEFDYDTIIERVGGSHFCYQYVNPTQDGNPVYSAGKVAILISEEGFPSFKHWSGTYLKRHGNDVYKFDETAIQPQHTGYVFCQGTRMFLWGWGEQTLRLAIMQFPTKFRRRDVYELHGIVVSTRSDPQSPFASRFVMVHDENLVLKARYDPGRKKKISGTTTKSGQEYFDIELQKHGGLAQYLKIEP